MVKTFGRISLLTLCVVAFGGAVLALIAGEPASTVAHTPRYDIASSTPNVSASSYLVFDLATGEVITEGAADIQRPIASVTKLMTAAVILNLIPLETKSAITWSDVETFGRAGKLETGQEYSARELLMPLLLESSNDAATALDRMSENTLIAAMNERAIEYDSDARFADPSGLSRDNIASAYGVAALLTGVYSETPEVIDIMQLTQYIGEYTGWKNNNPAASDPRYVGGKHGFTNASGLTYAGVFSHQFAQGERQLGYVLLKSEDLRADITALHEFVETNVGWQ